MALCTLLVGLSGACGGGGNAAPDPSKATPTQPAFLEVAVRSGLPDLSGMCMAFEDFTGDGAPDLLMPNRSELGSGTIELFQNGRNGTFRSLSSLPVAVGEFNGCAAGDIDNDGWVDVAVSAFSASRVFVFRNEGNGTFTQVAILSASTPASTDGLQRGFGALGFADFDADGLLDVVAAPFLQWPSMVPTCNQTADGFACSLQASRCMPPPAVFRNLGGGAFGPAVLVAPPETCGPANAYALAITDYNGDNRPDVFVANDFGVDALYVQGEAPLTFTDVAPTLGLKGYNHGMGAAFADYDRDGQLDLYVADLGSDQFYLGTGGGALSKRGQDWGVAGATTFHSGWAALAEDFDSDGFTDVWIANAAAVASYDELQAVGRGDNLAPRKQSDFLLRNHEGRSFDLVQVPQSHEAPPAVAAGASATADFDGDGRMDVAETLGYPMRFQLLHNTGASGHFIELHLVGHRSNRDALGALVTLHQAGGPDVSKLVQRTRGSVGASSALLHFGLGSATAIRAITIRWPSGAVQTLSSIAAVDEVLQVDEP